MVDPAGVLLVLGPAGVRLEFVPDFLTGPSDEFASLLDPGDDLRQELRMRQDLGLPGGEQVARGMGDDAVELVDRVPVLGSGEVILDPVEGLFGQQQAVAAGESPGCCARRRIGRRR